MDSGPFDAPPIGLTRLAVSNPECPRAWLLRVLHDSGVSLGDFDREALDVVLEGKEWDVVQAVAGWVARAHRTEA